MKIEDRIPATELNKVERSPEETRQLNQRTDEKAKPVLPGETLELSARGRELAATLQRAQDVPEARSERVEALRASLESGTYSVKGEAVAESILRSVALDVEL